MQFSSVVSAAALSSVALAGYGNETVVTTDITVTAYTTYCPEPTTFTVTTCEDKKCGEHVVTVTEAATVTVTEECIVPTTYTTEHITITETECDTCTKTSTATEECDSCTLSQSSVQPEVSSFEGAANKHVAGVFAGVAALAAALL